MMTAINYGVSDPVNRGICPTRWLSSAANEAYEDKFNFLYATLQGNRPVNGLPLSIAWSAETNWLEIWRIATRGLVLEIKNEYWCSQLAVISSILSQIMSWTVERSLWSDPAQAEFICLLGQRNLKRDKYPLNRLDCNTNTLQAWNCWTIGTQSFL